MSDSKKHKTPASRTTSETAGQTIFPVVGIGASAGGLEAYTSFLKALRSDLGMAYVLVPHLDRSHASAFPEILARATPLPVLEVVEGTAVKPNHIYVIPRNSEMTIAQGVLHLTQHEQPRSVNTGIDIFLRSLAADQGSNAIGVVLSGTATDGTLGLTAIKGEGGITFAQDSSAKYDGMPASAVASGCVDFVFSPAEIANELGRIAQHPYLRGKGIELEEVGDTKEKQMAQVFAMLRRITRVDFSEYKPPTVGRRVARRMALHKLEDLHDYVALLQHNNDEVKALYQDLLINVTSFFRDPQAFEALKSIVYPTFIERQGSRMAPIRMWVPGCSTGEEAYSHAMSVVEFLGEERAEIPIQIFGTDLSETAIQRARAGLYKESIEADISPIRLRRFFHRVDGGYQISKTIRDLCVFSEQNVFSDPPFSRIDLVSCRNVMIYLSQKLQERVAPLFHYALNPGGFLMVGSSEGLLGSGTELFDMADKTQKIYRKKAAPTPVTFRFPASTPESYVDQAELPQPGKVGAAVPPMPPDLQREADRLLLARYSPPAVIVDDQLDIIQSKGHTSSFLELPVGKASLNLLKMARSGLLYELQNAIDEARKSGMDAVRTNVSVEQNGGANLINLRVTPFRTPIQDKTSFIVVFEPPTGLQSMPSAEAVPSPLSEDERNVKDRQILQLKQELDAAKEYLQSIIEALESTNEELQSANEEIQSGNEEMQSTNEELQTSKEELESANEELHTVNEEMQHRNELLTQLNNDLTNLLNSVNLPIVMVGPDLSVRRFTPQAAKVLGLTAADFGRPITRLRLKTDLDNLEQVLLDVIAEVRPQQYRIRDSEGNLCALRLTPYRTADNRIDGVVLNVLGPNEIGSVGAESPPAAAHAAEKRVASKTAKKAAASKDGKTRKKL